MSNWYHPTLMVVLKLKGIFTTSSQDNSLVKERELPLYVTSTCYAMNTFVSPTTGFSPYELVFLEKVL